MRRHRPAGTPVADSTPTRPAATATTSPAITIAGATSLNLTNYASGVILEVCLDWSAVEFTVRGVPVEQGGLGIAQLRETVTRGPDGTLRIRITTPVDDLRCP